MEELEKEFVPYQESLELKNLGFNKPCLALYEKDNDELFTFHSDSYQKVTGFFCLENQINAPTFSQAFRWFREKYKLDGSPYPYYTKWAYQVLTLDLTGKYHYYSTVNSRTEFPNNFITYEEAELACLRKLIEISKK